MVSGEEGVGEEQGSLFEKPQAFPHCIWGCCTGPVGLSRLSVNALLLLLQPSDDVLGCEAAAV